MKANEITNQYEKQRELISELRMLLSKKGIDIDNPKNKIDSLILSKLFELKIANLKFQCNNLGLNWKSINTCESMEQIKKQTKEIKEIEFHSDCRKTFVSCNCK